MDPKQDDQLQEVSKTETRSEPSELTVDPEIAKLGGKDSRVCLPEKKLEEKNQKILALEEEEKALIKELEPLEEKNALCMRTMLWERRPRNVEHKEQAYHGNVWHIIIVGFPLTKPMRNG